MSLVREYDFFERMNELQETRRWEIWDAAFSESVSEHAYKMIVMVDRLFDVLELDLDYRKCVRMAMYHDLGEMGLDNDTAAYDAAMEAGVMEEAKKREAEKVREIAEKYKCPKIFGVWREYEKQATPEARFVGATDKLESTVRAITVKDAKLVNADFMASYCDDAVRKFPRLIPFYRVVKERMRERFEAQGLEWKKEYDALSED